MVCETFCQVFNFCPGDYLVCVHKMGLKPQIPGQVIVYCYLDKIRFVQITVQLPVAMGQPATD